MTPRPVSLPLSRRAFVRNLGALALAGLAPHAVLAAPRREVVVVTSYPDEVVSRFEAAFEKAHPAYRLRILWRAAHDALPTLRGPGVDVCWTPSPRNFALLKKEGRLAPLNIDRASLPGRLGKSWIDDPEGFYAATEIAAYGFAVNPDYLKKRGLPTPTDWGDLADARYAGHIALPNPGRVGFAPVMADIPLQAYGWDKGWAMWSALAANAVLLNAGGTFSGDEVASGRRGIGLSIDFFVAGAIAKGAPLAFVYPRHGGVNPSQAAILAGSPNPEGARAFVGFLLSEAGQRLLTHPDIRRLPVRPGVYASINPGYYDPFTAAGAGGFDYDGQRGVPRLPVIAALFETALSARHETLAALWAKARSRGGPSGEAAMRLLGAAPASEAEADQADWQQVFANRRDDPAAETAAAALETRWAAERDARFAQAEKTLETP